MITRSSAFIPPVILSSSAMPVFSVSDSSPFCKALLQSLGVVVKDLTKTEPVLLRSEEALVGTDRHAGDAHAVDHKVEVAREQHAVLEGAGLALVGVADHVVRVAPRRRGTSATWISKKGMPAHRVGRSGNFSEWKLIRGSSLVWIAEERKSDGSA